MVSQRYSIRSAHLVMWSSPLLLLVLVFTLTNSTPAPGNSDKKHHPSALSSTTTSRATSFTTPVTTIRPRVTSTTSTAPTTTTSEASANPYGGSISSTATSVALAPNVNASSGALEGTLNPNLEVADVPLQGPGTWTLATSAQSHSRLSCSSVSEAVVARVSILSTQSCQLVITSFSPGVSQTWQLTPTP